MTRRRILLIAIAANLVAAVAGGASWRLAIPSSSTRSTTTTSSSSTTLPGVDIGVALHVQAPEVSRNLERPRDLPPSSTPTSPPTTGTPTTSSQVAKPEHPQGYGYAGASLGRYRITCYGPPQFPAGQHTADGTPVGPGIVAGDLPFGTRLQLDGLGPVTVHDRGGAVHGRHLDLWRSSCAGWSNPTVEVFRR